MRTNGHVQYVMNSMDQFSRLVYMGMYFNSEYELARGNSGQRVRFCPVNVKHESFY